MVGKVINKYRLDAKIGEGGMGVVYKAWDTVLERPVALKMMHPMLVQDEKFLQRFRAEAKVLAQLENPHIVAVYDLQETEDGLFIVMQFVEGMTLAEQIARAGPLPYSRALPIFRQVLSALDHAHRAGVIHRDIKPSNVLLTPSGEVKVTDFGLAKYLYGTALTQSFATAGTPHYMPPEQFKDLAKVDQRSDIYAAGMTFYEMLAGRLPFDKNESIYTLPKKIVEGKFFPPDHYHSEVPKALSKIVMIAIDTNPAKRYQSAEKMLAAITNFEKNQVPTVSLPPPQPVPFRKIGGRVIAYALLLTLVLISGIIFLSTDLRQRLFTFFVSQKPPALSVATVPDSATSSRIDSLIDKPVEKSVVEGQKTKEKTQKGLTQKEEKKESSLPDTASERQVPPKPVEPSTGKLQVLVKPFGTIYIDEVLRQEETDILYTTDVSAGLHRVRIVHPKFGYWEEDVDIKQNSSQAIEVDFKKIVKITVTVASETSKWAEIYVDGKPIDQQTPSVILLHVGKHRIEVRREGYFAEEGVQVLNLKNDLEKPVVFTLKKRP